MIAVIIYCYLIKYWPKQKHLLPNHVINNKLLINVLKNRGKYNDKLKKNSIKNRTCFYFDDIIKIEDFDFHNILSNEK